MVFTVRLAPVDKVLVVPRRPRARYSMRNISIGLDMGAYQIVTGFFAQDDPAADGVRIGALPPRFGLLDDSPSRWSRFATRIEGLNAAAPPGTRYKVCFFVRHGQGYHNVAEAKYGRELWDQHWSKLYRDEELVWGPDPDLTSIGVVQAEDARRLWETELEYNVPLPQKHYASPLQRALRTWHEIFVKSESLSQHASRVKILEDLREEHGEHTCDMRSPRKTIAEEFPPPIYEFEEGFAEEDTIWKADERETKPHVRERAQAVLDRIFSQDEETYICITAHSGIINGFIAAMGRPRYPLPTGGILPLVIKGEVGGRSV
ncbi:phosphoglycerate mutase-like protein [Trametes polyzona]|nr:phosphoglycerate mutase-like protein [Trametes polyzona]